MFAGVTPGRTCRRTSPGQDYLYRDELKNFEKLGIVQVEAVPSRAPGRPETYVQDHIRSQQAQVWQLLEQDAVIFVCGNASTMASAVRKAFMQVYQEQTQSRPREDHLTVSGRS